VAEGKAYYCFCTPEKLEADRKAAQERKDPFQGYQRTCRDIDPTEAQARVDAGEPYTIRIKVPLDRGDVIVHDAVHGDVTFNAKELDDFIIFRSDGTPTYNFATVVDDARMGITHIIRGDDHLSNTPRQIMVYEALGAPTPTFAHISMILGTDGKKLSKRHGATSVEEYRDAGYLSDAFVNYLSLLGWAPDGESTVISRERLASEFSLDHVSKNPAIMDPKKLDYINGEYLHAMDDEQFAREVLVPELVKAGLETEGALSHDEAWYALLARALKPRCTLSADVCAQARYLYTADDELAHDEKAVKKWLAKAGAGNALDAAKKVLADCDWTPEAIEAALDPLPEQLSMGKGKVFQPIRVAVVGSAASPGIGETLALAGRDHVLARIERARSLAG
jgi:glutamyl-tRNA synthetase